jgi:hypothetical protein
MFINASSTISYQPTFRVEGFSAKLEELKPPSALKTPDYTDIIPAMDRRRMSEVLKMSIACSMECLKQSGLQQPEAIIVGTSMGCCTHSRNFLDKIFTANGGLISPTSFILSTHNTIAGQISLHLKNHGYNMTHTQNSLSFEHALIDALLCEKDGIANILVGAADEIEEAMYNLPVRLNLESIIEGAGATFFILSSAMAGNESINLVDVGTYGLIKEISPHINDFLRSNSRLAEEIDLVLFSNSHLQTINELDFIFGSSKIFDYQTISGTWFTNSAFAMNYGVDILQQGSHPLSGKKKVNKLMICNNLVPENLGLILLEGNADIK